MDELIEESNEEDLPEDIKAIVRKVARKRKKNHTDNHFFAPLLLLGWFLCVLYCIGARQIATLVLLIVGCVPVFLAFSIYVRSQRAKGYYSLSQEEANRLLSHKDRRLLGALIDLAGTDQALRYTPQLQNRSSELMSLLTPEDASLLMKRQKAFLVRCLYSVEKTKQITFFQVLEQIGDTDQLPALKRWRFNQLLFNDEHEVLAAYNSCVAAIEVRAAATRTDAQLLRPSSPSDDPATLLRPHTHKPDENAETLLRAGHGGDEDTRDE